MSNQETESEETSRVKIQNRGVFNTPHVFQFVLDKDRNKITLGEGSFGFVMLIRHIESQELYALKLVSLDSLTTRLERKVVEREVRIHPDLHHPYIIKMYDAFIHKQAIFIILEYAVNKSVSEIFLRNFVYDEARAFKYFYQTCLAVHYLHHKGVMHRDIKPENLLLDENDNIKLCDFGWCAEITSSRRSTLCGTFEYMSPEVIMGKEYDYQVDLWQLGILLYELLHGKTPFKPKQEFDSQEQRMDYFRVQICQGNIEFSEDVSHSACELMKKLLVYIPERRLSIQGVLADIWVFQMKSKTNTKDSEQILQQLSQAEQTILFSKQEKEEELLQLQKIRRTTNSSKQSPQSENQYFKPGLLIKPAAFSISQLSMNLENVQEKQEVDLFKQTNLYNHEANGILAGRDGNTKNTGEAVHQIPQKQHSLFVESTQNKEQPILPQSLSLNRGNSKDNSMKDWDKPLFSDVLYEREYARMQQNNQGNSSYGCSVLDFHGPLLKKEGNNNNFQPEEPSLVPSFLRRISFQSRNQRAMLYIKQSSNYKASTQLEIANSTRRTIFGDFDKEKRIRNIKELDKLMQQVDFDNNSSSKISNSESADTRVPFSHQIQMSHGGNNDTISQISQGSQKNTGRKEANRR